jgi:hypothetical protein
MKAGLIHTDFWSAQSRNLNAMLQSPKGDRGCEHNSIPIVFNPKAKFCWRQLSGTGMTRPMTRVHYRSRVRGLLHPTAFPTERPVFDKSPLPRLSPPEWPLRDSTRRKVFNRLREFLRDDRVVSAERRRGVQHLYKFVML